MKKTVLSVLALSALVYSCKKDDDKSNAEKIVGKWSQTTLIENDHSNGVDHRDTTNIPSGYNTIEFTSNGKYYERGPIYTDTAIYKVDGSNLIVQYTGNANSDTLQIKTLTGSDLVLYTKDMDTNGDYDEGTGIFKKN
jgi:hypothetical protein